MATNLKGQGGIKGILLLHGEKIAIVIVGVIALWFMYGSYKVPRLKDEFQADKLQSEITQTSTEIHSFTWDKAVSDHPDKVKKAQTITASSDLSVDPKAYVNIDAKGKPIFGVDDSIVAPLILRADPLMLNAIDVRATGGSGLIPFVDEEIRKQQAIRLAQEAKEAERKALEKQKREAAKAKEGGAPGARRNQRPEGPASGIAEPVDPAHPKRRMVDSTMRSTSTMLQGGERIERAYWACVVAKVPIREQFKLYQDAFEKARGGDATRDFPNYVGYFVERSEVVPGKDLDWKPVPLYDGQRQSIAQNKSLSAEPGHVVAKPAFDKFVEAAQKFWASGISQDVIDERFAEYPLTLPLPPLVGREWGAEATHPDIPLAINTPPLEDPNQQTVTPTAEQQPAQTDSNAQFGSANTGQGPATGGTNSFGPAGGRPGGEFPGGPAQRRFGGPEGGPGTMGPGMSPGGRRVSGPGMSPEGGMYRGGGGGGGGGQVATQHTSLPPKGVDNYLLRFFDFSVEPGKKYKYRVKLVIWDPNFNLPANVLSSVVLDRQMKEFQALKAKNPKAEKPFFRVIQKWSDPSPSVGIPMAGNVRLAETKIPPADKFNDEPTVKMLVEAFDVDETGNPIQGAAEKDFHRGYVANMVQDTEYLVNPAMIDTLPSFKFLTGMTLLDVDGGTKISKESKDLTVPARILVMGPAGELYIRNELDDKSYVESHRLIFEKPSDKRNGPQGPEGPGAPGGPSRPRKAGR